MSDWRFSRPAHLPLPQPTQEARPFFAALQEGRLAIQQCAACGTLSHPPKAMCSACHGTAFQWETMTGKGDIYSYVVTHQAVHPAFVDHTPMATVEVELAEGPHLVSNLVDVPPSEVWIGLPVEVVFEDIGNGVVLPLFRRIHASRSKASLGGSPSFRKT